MNQQGRIILASQSPQRKNILSTLDITFESIPADLDELAITADTHIARAEKIALSKATKIQEENKDAIIIAGDTYLIEGEKAFEKPNDLAEAAEMLAYLSGREVQEVTGFAYLDATNNIEFSTTVVVTLTFRELSAKEIKKYVENEPVLTWSAAFCPAYDTGAALVASVHGSVTAFTHGLPLELVVEHLRKSGVEI